VDPERCWSPSHPVLIVSSVHWWACQLTVLQEWLSDDEQKTVPSIKILCQMPMLSQPSVARRCEHINGIIVYWKVKLSHTLRAYFLRCVVYHIYICKYVGLYGWLTLTVLYKYQLTMCVYQLCNSRTSWHGNRMQMALCVHNSMQMALHVQCPYFNAHGIACSYFSPVTNDIAVH